MTRTLILGSTSPFRRELLAKLGLPFEWAAPAIDETRHPGECAEAMVQRLALEKAQAVAGHHADALVIGQPAAHLLEVGLHLGLGVVGLLTTAAVARFPLYALVAVDPLAERRELAASLGADAVLEDAVIEACDRVVRCEGGRQGKRQARERRECGADPGKAPKGV